MNDEERNDAQMEPSYIRGDLDFWRGICMRLAREADESDDAPGPGAMTSVEWRLLAGVIDRAAARIGG